jgi:hypothetical protein
MTSGNIRHDPAIPLSMAREVAGLPVQSEQKILVLAVPAPGRGNRSEANVPSAVFMAISFQVSVC